MEKKITFALILLMLLGITPKMKAQDDTIRSLIFTEVYAPNRYHNYVELTNVGAEPVNLSNFEMGSTRYSVIFPGSFPVRVTMLPDVVLEPDSSFLFAMVIDYQDNYGRFLDPWVAQRKYGVEKTWDEFLMKLDTAIYGDEDIEGRQGGKDSISLHDHVISLTESIGLYLEQHVGEDSVVVDGVRLVLQDDGYPDTDEKFATVAGIPLAYPNYVLVRKTNVTEGNIDWDDARGNSIEDSEWLPIPDRSNGVYNNTSRFFTTIRHHGISMLNNEFVNSDIISIDWENEEMTVPWGIYRDSIMDYFNIKDGIAWHFHRSPSTTDSISRIVVSGDTLTLYAVGEDLKQIDFALTVADPSEDINLVFPKNRRTVDAETGAYEWSTPYYVTNDGPVIDTIGSISYQMRIDSLFKYLEKAENASWELVWVDDTERVDLKYGDKLKVTAQNGTSKDYFLDIAIKPEPSHNAFLGAITWPEAPTFLRESPQWNDDTIPSFSNGIYSYDLKVPYGTSNVPALMAIPEDLNAQITVDRATVITGPVEDRTTTFTVAAEDDTTINVYSVIFSEEKPSEMIQPFYTEPIITDLYQQRTWNNRALEISNPGNQPLDLSDYMIVVGQENNPADLITNHIEEYDDRFARYVPGYKYQPEAIWPTNPNTILRDFDVNPIIEPGGSFVISRVRNQDYASDEVAKYYDVMMTLTKYGVTLDEEATGCKSYWLTNSSYYVSFWRYDRGQLCIFKILNDSVKAGTKPVTDPNDFELIEMVGNWTGDAWDPYGEPLPWDEHRLVRKSQYWQGDTLPGQSGSFGANEEESEWILTQLGWDPAWEVLTSGAIGSHTFDPIFDYNSTVSSFVYKVSDGYQTPQSITGVVSGTTVSGFFANIDKAHEDQALKVMGKEESDVLAEGDTLIVTSADSTNVTKYEIIIGALSADAELTAKDGSGYTVSLSDSEGTISGIQFGSTIKEVLNNLNKPGKALLNVIDNSDDLVPLQIRNFKNEYVDTKASDRIKFEVIAENGLVKNYYQLEIGSADDEAYLYSDVYDVDQDQLLISSIPAGTNINTLLKYLFANEGSTIKIVNKAGSEKVQGDLVADDEIIVTSPDLSVENVYFISFLDGVTGTLAYVVSNVLNVDQQLLEISGIPQFTTYDSFMEMITPATGASVEVLDSDQQPVVSGTMENGYTLVVTSGDNSKMVTYTLSVETLVKNSVFDQIRIYPNPATDELFIEGMNVDYGIIIKNISGQTVRIIDNKHSLNGSISIGNLPDGLYLIYATYNNQHSRPIKLIKQ